MSLTFRQLTARVQDRVGELEAVILALNKENTELRKELEIAGDDFLLPSSSYTFHIRTHTSHISSSLALSLSPPPSQRVRRHQPGVGRSVPLSRVESPAGLGVMILEMPQPLAPGLTPCLTHRRMRPQHRNLLLPQPNNGQPNRLNRRGA